MSRFFHVDEKTGKVIEGRKPVKQEKCTNYKPLECFASGVHASQAQDLRDFFHNHGESVEVTNNGDPVYTSANQRKRCLKLRGFVDKSSYC